MYDSLYSVCQLLIITNFLHQPYQSDLTERTINLPTNTSDVIILRTRRRNYPIKVTNFAKYSEKIALLLKNDAVPPAIDLSCYNIDAVRTLTDFVADVDKRNLRLNDSMLTDLLQLARIFRMHQLTAFLVEHVIEKVGKGPQSNLLLALNLVSSDWSMFLHINEASALLESAAENINEVTTSTFFNMLPAAVLVMLYSRCDVNISSELELSHRLIRWLKKTERTDGEAEMLFGCVRTPFLSSNERETIREKCIGLPQNMINIIELTLDSPRNHRCCVIREHIERQYPRCGIPDNHQYLKINAINIINKPIIVKKMKDGKKNYASQAGSCDSGLSTARSSVSDFRSDAVIGIPEISSNAPKMKKIENQKQKYELSKKRQLGSGFYKIGKIGSIGKRKKRSGSSRTYQSHEGDIFDDFMQKDAY